MIINRNISEKVIGIILITWSCIKLYYTSSNLINIFEISDLSWEEVSIFKVVKNYHFQYIIPILSIVSGLLLILNKRVGWIGSTVMSFVTGIGIIILSWKLYNAEGNSIEITISDFLLPSFLTVLFLIIGLVLLSKVYREEYLPTKNTWIIMILTIIILCVYSILIN